MKSVGLDRIFVSPLGRAQATAKYTTDALGMQSSIEDWTCEVSGAYYHGSPGSEVKEPRQAHRHLGHARRTDSRQTALADRKNLGHDRPRVRGDRPREVQHHPPSALDKFLANLGYEGDAGRFRVRAVNEQRVALFCHNGTMLISSRTASGNSPPAGLVGLLARTDGAVTTILFEQRSKEWAVPRALAVGDTSHLYAAGLDIRPRGIPGQL